MMALGLVLLYFILLKQKETICVLTFEEYTVDLVQNRADQSKKKQN
jgi:hypothetical protein